MIDNVSTQAGYTDNGTMIKGGSTSTTGSSIGVTQKGTKIIKSGDAMDKNAFLRIMAAELSNQDPQNNQDPTQYVSQMAQFSGLEQMANLNNSLLFSSASTMIGKNVKLNSLGADGNLVNGLVKSVAKNGDEVNLNVEVTENGQKVTKVFPYSDVIQIQDQQG